MLIRKQRRDVGWYGSERLSYFHGESQMETLTLYCAIQLELAGCSDGLGKELNEADWRRESVYFPNDKFQQNWVHNDVSTTWFSQDSIMHRTS